MKALIPLLIFFVSIDLSAKLLKHEVGRLNYEMFSLKDACTFAGFKHVLLAEKKDTLSVDCMGTTLKAIDFCQKKYPAATDLLRGYVEKTGKYVICERGKTVHVTVSCDERDKHFCKKEKWGCQKLGKAYARDLTISHTSLIRQGRYRNLNCYYSQALKVSEEDLKDL